MYVGWSRVRGIRAPSSGQVETVIPRRAVMVCKTALVRLHPSLPDRPPVTALPADGKEKAYERRSAGP